MSPTPGNHRARRGEHTIGRACLPRIDECRLPISRIERTKPLVGLTPFPGGLALEISGELDISSAGALERALWRAGASSKLVLLDLRQTTFMDAAALKVITRNDGHLREFGARLVVVPGSLAVRRLLGVTGMYRRLEIVDHCTTWQIGA